MYNESLDPTVVASFGLLFWAVFLGVYLFFAYTQYKIAQKCNCEDSAWWSFIPVMNAFLLLKMAEKPYWWFLLFLVPLVNIFAVFSVWINVAKNAGHSAIWGVLAVIPILNLFAVAQIAFTGKQPVSYNQVPSTPTEHRSPTHVG